MKNKRVKPMPVRIVHDGPSEPYKPKDSMSISMRKIENGYIVNRHGYKDGKHFDEEKFTPHEPKIDFPSSGGRGTPRSPGRNQRLARTKL